MACGKAELGVSGYVSDGSHDQQQRPQTASYCVVEEGAENNPKPTSCNPPVLNWIKGYNKLE
jgi:hypothetical protein